MKYTNLIKKFTNVYEPRVEGRPYKKLSKCHFKVGQEICGSADLCDHKGWPTLCKDHCNKW